MKRYNCKTASSTSSIGLMALALGWAVAAPAQESIEDVLGTYDVFLTTNQNNHNNAVITIARTGRRANNSEADTFGLAIVLTDTILPRNRGDGFMCPEATLLPGDLALSCSRTVRNPRGRPIFVETLLVGTSGSPFCEALRESLTTGQENVVDEMHPDCDEDDEQCICYDIRSKGDAPVAPPSSGSGSGRNR